MKYFTKEFYTLQRLAFANNYLKTSKKAEKKNDKFYQRIYDKRCDFYVNNERRCEPYIDPKEELRKIDEFCNAPDISDEERSRRLEIRKAHLYINRERIESGIFYDFDEQTVKRQFAERQNIEIETYRHLPKEILDKIADIRVFALGYASAEVINLLRPYCEKLRKAVKQIIDTAYAETNKSEKLLNAKLNFNDYETVPVLSLKEIGGDIYLESEDNEYLVFKGGKILEGQGHRIYPYNSHIPNSGWSVINTAELHSTENEFEANFLISNLNEIGQEELWYLSISATDIIEKTIK